MSLASRSSVLKMEGMKHITMCIHVNLQLLFMLFWADVKQRVWPGQERPGVWTEHDTDNISLLTDVWGFSWDGLKAEAGVIWRFLHSPSWSLDCLGGWAQQSLLTKAPTCSFSMWLRLEEQGSWIPRGNILRVTISGELWQSCMAFFFFLTQSWKLPNPTST